MCIILCLLIVSDLNHMIVVYRNINWTYNKLYSKIDLFKCSRLLIITNLGLQTTEWHLTLENEGQGSNNDYDCPINVLSTALPVAN